LVQSSGIYSLAPHEAAAALTMSFFNRTRDAWERRGVRLGVALAGFAIVTLATFLIAHPRMFTGFISGDDEGYMLIALKSFLNHGSLYDDVFSQYGPFYYEFWGTVFSLFGVPVNHDGGRSVVMVVWVLSALLVGIASWQMTRSILLGLAVQVLVFNVIGSVANEPMHPGGIICLLLGGIVVASCLVRGRVSPGAMGWLGGLVAALILVKVNVGIFALAAAALACVVSYPVLERRRWPRLVVEIGFVAIPILLMTSKLGEAWARDYAAHVAVAALAVVIVLRSRSADRRDPKELWWLGGGLAVVAVAVCVAIVAMGTSPSDLIDGVLIQPLRLPGAFSLPLDLSNEIYFFDLLGLSGAVAYWYAMRHRNAAPGPVWVAVTSLVGILIGAEMALSTMGRTVLFDFTIFPGYRLSLLAFAWVALLPAGGHPDRETSFARLLLPPLAVMQALHAFPVAGSQLQWSTFLLVPVGAICIANGVRGLAGALPAGAERRALAGVGALAAAIAALALGNVMLRQQVQQARAAYNASVSLGLPGATDMRLFPGDVELYREITAGIDRRCSSFLTLPGMNSFYIWTDQEPPTGYNATAWPDLFDDAQQQRIIKETRSIRGLCLLENAGLAEGWSAGVIPDVPLVRYLDRGFEPIAQFGNYRLLKRDGN
jgi:hypothetical protein